MSVTFLICLKRFDIIFQTLKKIIQFDIIYFEMKKNLFFDDFYLMWSEFFFMITDTVDLHIHVYTVIYIFMFTQMKNIKLVLHTVKYTKIILL